MSNDTTTDIGIPLAVTDHRTVNVAIETSMRNGCVLIRVGDEVVRVKPGDARVIARMIVMHAGVVEGKA